MKHIFIALGQHHVKNFENLIEKRLIEEGETILVAGSDVIIDESKWSTLILSEGSFNNNADSLFHQLKSIDTKIKKYKSIIKQLEYLKNEATTVYTCYIEDVLSNYMFLSFSKQSKAVIVEDGTLNYYNHTLKNIDPKKFFLKQFIAKLNGIPFKRYKGHSSGAEYSKVIAQFLTFPENAFITSKAKLLPVQKEENLQFTNTLFIVGQEPYGALLGQAHFETELDLFLKRLKEAAFYSEITEVFYKPHRNGKQLSPDLFINAFPDKKVNFVLTDKTSETYYFQDIKSKHIAGFDSSTLINIYSKLNETDRKKVQFIANPLKNDELVPLFKGLEFTFLNLN